MNRVGFLHRGLSFTHHGVPTPEMVSLQRDLVTMLHNRKIFGRLKVKLIAYDQLEPAEVVDIQRILHDWPEVSPFACWVVDQYLVRAHFLELDGWSPCPFDQMPTIYEAVLERYGEGVVPILRQCAL